MKTRNTELGIFSNGSPDTGTGAFSWTPTSREEPRREGRSEPTTNRCSTCVDASGGAERSMRPQHHRPYSSHPLSSETCVLVYVPEGLLYVTFDGDIGGAALFCFLYGKRRSKVDAVQCTRRCRLQPATRSYQLANGAVSGWERLWRLAGATSNWPREKEKLKSTRGGRTSRELLSTIRRHQQLFHPKSTRPQTSQLTEAPARPSPGRPAPG